MTAPNVTPQYTMPTVNNGAPNSAFASPPVGSAPYVPYGGDAPWSPKLNQEIGDTPDPMRLHEVPQRELYPDPGESPEAYYYGVHGPANDEMQRQDQEYRNAVGWITPAPNRKNMAPDPRWTPPAEYRPTQRMGPNTYTFTRPVDQNLARRFNGSHFSMADHRRNYPVYGMAPAGSWRSTVRVDPAPWGSNIVDNAANNGENQSFSPNPQIPNYEVPMGTGRWVLGG